jgi:hypothetical protein
VIQSKSEYMLIALAIIATINLLIEPLELKRSRERLHCGFEVCLNSTRALDEDMIHGKISSQINSGVLWFHFEHKELCALSFQFVEEFKSPPAGATSKASLKTHKTRAVECVCS